MYLQSSEDTLAVIQQSYPVAFVFLDVADFKSQFTHNDGDKWMAMMFLSSSRFDKATALSSTFSLLEYEENADRNVMTIRKSSWIDSFHGSVKLVTRLAKDGTNQYKITASSYGLEVTVERTGSSTTEITSYEISFRLICVGGTIGSSGQREVVLTNSSWRLSFSSGDTSKTYRVGEISGNNFVFDANATTRHAIVAVTLKPANSYSSIGVATDIDCASGSSTYNETNTSNY